MTAADSSSPAEASVFAMQQDDGELTLTFACAAEVTAARISCDIKPQRLKVLVHKEVRFEDELIGKVDMEESCWQIEKAKGGDKQLVVTLVKANAGKVWKCVGKREAARLQDEANANNKDLKLMSVNEFAPDDDTENADKNENDEKVLEAEFLELRKAKGLDNDKTLDKFFELFDNSIQLYRLNKLAKYLEDVLPVCRRKTGDSKYKLKGVQAYAFVLWKMNKFREALPLFLEMEDMIGRNGALCENIAHTYNSLGNYEKAEEYFSAALKYCQNDESATSQKGGVLLGLGLVRERQGKMQEAETIVRQSYEFYKRRSCGQLNSLQAKAGVALAKILTTLGRVDDAEKLLKEAVRIYEVTCGAYSPLTCSGYTELGKLQWDLAAEEQKNASSKAAQDSTTVDPSPPSASSSTAGTPSSSSATKTSASAGEASPEATKLRLEARKNLKRAYEICIRKDHIDIIQWMEVHNGIMDTITQKTAAINRKDFRDFRDVVEEGIERLKKDVKQDGNAGVYFKLAGEFLCWTGEAFAEGKSVLAYAQQLFEVEKSCDCTKLIQECKDMIAYADRVMSGEQENIQELKVNEAERDRIQKNLDRENAAFREQKTKEKAAAASGPSTKAPMEIDVGDAIMVEDLTAGLENLEVS